MGTGDFIDTNSSRDIAGYLIILGHPNVGKTTLADRLCGRTFRMPESPGCPEIGRGKFSCHAGVVQVVDMPGISGIDPLAERDSAFHRVLFSERPRAVLLVGDGKNLRRTLIFAIELSEYGVPAVLVMNMADESRQRGIIINYARLASILGVDVVETVATRGEGLEELKSVLGAARPLKPFTEYGQVIEGALDRISALLKYPERPLNQRENCCFRAMGVRLLCGDEIVSEHVQAKWGVSVLRSAEAVVAETRQKFTLPVSALIAESRARAAEKIFQSVRTVVTPPQEPWAERISEWVCGPLTGVPIALGVLGVLYLFVGVVGAQWLAGLCGDELFGKVIVPLCERLTLGWPALPRDALLGEFGIISVGLALVLGVVAPVLTTFHIAFGLLEEVGYMPRLSILFDRMLKKMGLNGQGVIPILLGFNCVTAAVLSTRIFSTKKERVISTLLVIGLPCAPLLAVMLAVLSRYPLWALIMVFGVMFLVKVLIGMALKRLVPGHQSEFILEIPLMRFPKLGQVFVNAFRTAAAFILEAIPAFLTATFVLFVSDRMGALDVLRRFSAPIVKSLLGLPVEATEVFVMSVIRRESGAALLKQLCDAGIMSVKQLVVSLLVMTFLIPCVNTLLVVTKQHGARMAAGMVLLSVCFAISIGTMVHWIWSALNFVL